MIFICHVYQYMHRLWQSVNRKQWLTVHANFYAKSRHELYECVGLQSNKGFLPYLIMNIVIIQTLKYLYATMHSW